MKLFLFIDRVVISSLHIRIVSDCFCCCDCDDRGDFGRRFCGNLKIFAAAVDTDSRNDCVEEDDKALGDVSQTGGVDKLLLFVAWSLMKSLHMWSA
jgi:hypothetical protein